jgi:hypothetical protein
MRIPVVKKKYMYKKKQRAICSSGAKGLYCAARRAPMS